MKVYEELVWRGLIKDCSDIEQTKKLLNEDKIKFYCGFDPTGKSLTIGHLVQIVRMRLLQTLGHKPVVLIGGGTGLIGDPREVGERKLLTIEESLRNAKLIEKQISKFLDPDNTIYVNNYDWLSKIDIIPFLRDYGKFFNVNYMLAKETVSSRLETGISYTEFSYMILQSIDFLHLYEEHDVLLQFGGSDQWGNITAGLELIRKVKGKNDAIGLSSPLLLKSDGKKFGKSEGGAIWLDEDLTTPYELYQYFLNSNDDEVIEFIKTLTLLKKDEILELEESVKTNPGARLAQKRLAEEVVKFVHGKEKLEEALRVTDALFKDDFEYLNENEFRVLAKTLETFETNEAGLVEVLVKTKLANSNREAREFINNNAISLNGKKINDTNYTLTKIDAMHGHYVVIKRGRRLYAMVYINA